MFFLPNLDSTLNVLAAMVTPAVMILATSSLILTTTNRLVRVVGRVREMLPEFETLARSDAPDASKIIATVLLKHADQHFRSTRKTIGADGVVG